MSFRFCCVSLVFGCLSLASPSSWAALGGPTDSIVADTLSLKAVRHVEVRSSYQVHELDLASGTVVREYVTAQGTVFAVSWHGPFKPNLNQLLGSYFPRLTEAARLPHPDHSHLRVTDQDVTIESAGRMRAFAGCAVVTALVPAGVSVAEIQ